MSEVTRKLVQRAKKVAYANTGTTDAPTWTRMKGFTSLSKSKNPIEYSRQYVDEFFETTDATGMSESMEFEMDQYTNDAVHAKIVDIFDKEKVGDDANLEIMVVDYSAAGTGTGTNEYPALRRTYGVIPDTEGDGTESYKYSGSFKAKTPVTVAVVTATDGNGSATVVLKTT